MTIKSVDVSDLTGAALDWLVAKCEKVQISGASLRFQIDTYGTICTGFWPYSPTTDWMQGGPIIEREGITLDFSPADGEFPQPEWVACDRSGVWDAESTSPLFAAMRAYVASKMGGNVEVPEELC